MFFWRDEEILLILSMQFYGSQRMHTRKRLSRNSRTYCIKSTDIL